MNWIDTFTSQSKPIVALAPMDGYCDSAFRAVCQKVAGWNIVVFSEFYSADGLHHNPLLAKRVLVHDPIEHPLVFQIFGNTPEIFLSAGKIIESYGAQGVDINMGCPAKKVVKCGYGSGLMVDRDRAMKIVNILAENLNIPVTVKTRLGWNGADELVEFGQALEQAGAKLITVHGRTYQQEYTGNANWTPIQELQKNVKIPVLWNGDCKNYEDGINKMGNLRGFMIARGSLGNPWCFLPGNYEPTWQERLAVMSEHMERMVTSKWENRACLEIRKHFTHYLHGFEGVKEYRKRLAMVTSVSETVWILKELSLLDVVSLEIRQ
jgi:tRNA-dihydrouridine synthase B